MAYRKPIFQPVVLFQPETEGDEWAVKQVYDLHREVYATMDTERSRQQQIGISEIGGECRKCVARKLSGQYEKPVDPSWKAQVGTAIHAMLEEHFPARYPWMYERAADGKFHVRADLTPTDEQPLYHLEKRLRVHRYKTLDLGGSCDLFIQGASFGLVDDWKTQGIDKLRKTTAKGHMSSAYRVQMPTYGLGYELLGYTVTHLVMYALPRDGDLDEAKPILMRYDRQVAIDALAEIDKLIDTAELLEKIYPGQGWEKLVENQESAPGCFDCPRYKTSENRSFFAEMFA